MQIPSYLVSVPIPWDEDQSFDKDVFTEILGELKKQYCDGIYLFGTSGEGYALTDEEFSEIVVHFKEQAWDFSGFPPSWLLRVKQCSGEVQMWCMHGHRN